MKSIQPRKQRKEFYNAPLHVKRKRLASHLAENLLLKYDKRSIPVIKGDTVKVMRGSYKGHEDKIAHVHVKKGTVEIEGLTMVKADGKKIAKPINPSNVLIIKLNLTDKWRRKKLERGLTEDVRKEIEAEAKDQIKEIEVEKKKQEELTKEIEEPIEEELEESPIEESKPEETSKPKKTIEKPKEETKEPAKKETKTTPEKKPSVKKPTTTPKKTVKKTPAKTTKKKEEDKK